MSHEAEERIGGLANSCIKITTGLGSSLQRSMDHPTGGDGTLCLFQKTNPPVVLSDLAAPPSARNRIPLKNPGQAYVTAVWCSLLISVCQSCISKESIANIIMTQEHETNAIGWMTAQTLLNDFFHVKETSQSQVYIENSVCKHSE